MPTERSDHFRDAFRRRATPVRRRLAAKRIAAGTTLGLLVGAGAAAAAWWLRHGELRPYAAALGVLGAVAGAWVAYRRNWRDGEVALYLDRKLASKEAIATALELELAEDHAAHGAVLDKANEALDRTPPKGTWPRVLRAWHGLAPLAAGAIVWISLLALPPTPPAPKPPPGSEQVQLTEVKGLEKVIRLSELDPRDAEQAKRLRELSERAKKLREKLRKGMEKREAQAEIAKLRDDVAAERQRLGSGEQRAGLEAALGKLADKGKLAKARKALGDRDLTRFDEEMKKLANTLEKQDRDEAMKALEEAAEAARKKGAEDVARSLEEQKKLMEQRGKQADKLKALAKAFGDGLSDEAKRALENFQQNGSSGDQKELAEQLEKALEQLTEEERKRLAEKLKKMGEQVDPETSNMAPPDKKQLEQMQKQLSSAEGQKQLAEQLRQLANEPSPDSGDSKRQQGLGDAERGLGQTQRRLGGVMPMPMAGGQPGAPGKPGNKPGQQGGQNGKDGKDGKPGPGRGGDKGEHDGKTAPVDGKSLRAHAGGKLNPGAANPGVSMGRTTGRAGEVANRQGTGQLGVVAPDEVGAVERSDVPEEYREQVGRYFQP
jgi:hypothetical protein